MTSSIYRKAITVDQNQAKGFGNTHRLCPYLHMFRMKEGMQSLHISIENYDTQTDKNKFIYKALTLPGKQLLLKCDQSRSHKSAV